MIEEAKSRRTIHDICIHPLLLLALWMVTRPYTGIVHDARLYAIQAIRHSRPWDFASDLFFQFGSQDSYTIVSFIYAPVIAALGPSGAHMAATFLAHAFWISALLIFSVEVVQSKRQAWMAAYGVVLLNPAYGAMRVFGYGEPFATPRIFAEALVLLAVAALLRDRNTRCFVLLVAALLVHPLMALSGVAVALLVSVRDKRRLAVPAVILVMSVGTLAGQGVEPFARMLTSFDTDWFDAVAQRLPFALLSRWDAGSYVGLVLPVLSLVLYRRRANVAVRSTLDAVMVVSALSVAVSWFGADVWRNVFVVNVQIWRSLWLLMLVGNAVTVPVLLALPNQSAAKRFLSVAVCLTIAESWIRFPAYASGVVAILASAIAAYEYRDLRTLPRSIGTALAVVACIAIALDLAAVWSFVSERTGDDYSRINALAVWLAVGTICVCVWLSRHTPIVQGVLSVLALCLALYNVDRRSAWTRFVETDEHKQELSAFVANQQRVYWENGLGLLWLKLGKPSYYSCMQGAGVMFFRQTALEYQRRGSVLSILNTADFADPEGDLCLKKQRPAKGQPVDRPAIISVCRQLMDLDALVLTTRIAGVTAASWRSPIPIRLYRNGRAVQRSEFFLIRCADLRRGG